ncbi:MAG TPA: SPFH domain-containing protein [Gemmataceae bacterium]|jgi:membrane protease subunit HflK|nr:SPFH domain-containing protein [Gemmataceae bacterium]
MRRWALILVVIVIAGYLLTGVAQVQPGERAVVRRFGRVVRQQGPGLVIDLPYGMSRVDRVPVNFVRQVKVGFDPDIEEDVSMPEGQLLTGDQNLVNVQAAVDYRVGDGNGVIQYVLNRDRIEAAIARVTEAAMSEWVSTHTVDETLLTGKSALRTWLAPKLQERLDPYGLGVEIQSANVTFLAPPREVKYPFDRVSIAQAGIRTRENEARQYAEQKMRDALMRKNEMEQKAQAYALGRKRLAEAEAEAFLKRLDQYQRLRKDNPEILTAIWWAEMGKTLASMKANGQIDVLDERIGADGLDITQFAKPRKKN